MKPNRSIPQATVIPVLVYPDVRQAVDWLAACSGYYAEDFAGHQWTFSETIRDVAPEEWGGIAVPERPSAVPH